MTIHNISSPVFYFEHDEYGKRLLFKNGIINPRNMLGKLGVTDHSWFGSFFYSTIAINVNLYDKKGVGKETILYINRNSLLKYLGEDETSTDKQLITALNTKCWEEDNNASEDDVKTKQREHGTTGLRHAGQHNTIFVNTWYSAIGDYIKGSFLSWLYQKTISSFARIKARFLLVKTEQDLLDAGEMLAKKRFHEAYEDVPAYHEYVETKVGVPTSDWQYSDIPVTSKKDYVKPKEARDWELHFHGKYPDTFKIDTSTGTTGNPTPWYRSMQETEVVEKSLRLASNIQFKDRKILTINAFALGPWATGMSAHKIAMSTGSTFAAGADADKILAALENHYNYEQAQLDSKLQRFFNKYPRISQEKQQFLRKFMDHTLNLALKKSDYTIHELVSIQKKAKLKRRDDKDLNEVLFINDYISEIESILEDLNAEKKQVVIAGYPPFLKELCEHAKKKPCEFKKFSAIGVVGGQAMSEAMRDQLILDGFNQVYSSYGASDLDINLGVETEFEISIRKTIEKNPGLARELYGENKGLPMVFHYDPMNYHVECDENDDLIYTCARNDRSSPRVRYNLEDKGRIYAVSDVQALLAKYGVFQKPKTNLPLMFVWGRDSTVVFGGANLAFTELERVVTDDNELRAMVRKKAFYTHEDENGVEKLEIWLELNDDIPLPEEGRVHEYANRILAKLAEINQDLDWQFNRLRDGTELPKVRFFTRKNSPISEAGGHRKQVLVFKKGINLDKEYQFPDAMHCRAATILKGGEVEVQRGFDI